ncbi:MAG: PUA domain-containing protein [Candidatus Bathyarchaeia archaeon]
MHKTTALRKLRKIVDYQFGDDSGEGLFPDGVSVEYSPKTSRIRRVYLRGKLLATLRPQDGYLGLTVHGGKRLLKLAGALKRRVVAAGEAEEAVRRGGNVFAKHVLNSSSEIRPMDEVVVTNVGGEVIAVGRAVLPGSEMATFKRGVAVRVRHGAEDRE